VRQVYRSGSDAERPERRADAEHRHDSQLDVCITMGAGARVSVTLVPASIFKTTPSPHRQSAWQNAR
ncbi:hypothetical protein CVE30_20025, partial [Pseudomonas syringae pv. actinidiae]|nr:hypothetical protein [Pseudomonas syringae pv. actinidiae]